MSKISELTAQQEALIDVYRKKWQATSYSTQAINLEKASVAVEAVHRHLLRTEEFEIYFLDSPLAIFNLNFLDYILHNVDLLNPKKLNNIIRRVENKLIKSLFNHRFNVNIIYKLIEIVGKQLDIQLWNELYKQFYFRSALNIIYNNRRDFIKTSPILQSAKPNQQRRLEGLWLYLNSGEIQPDSYSHICSLLDYCISELKCDTDRELWEILKTFVVECGWTFMFQDFCFICQRPCKILVNEQNRPYAENEPTIEFSDGFRVFARKGIDI
ncbi:MAG: DUF6745 domain-containing protein [Crinalium sp.]